MDFHPYLFFAGTCREAFTRYQEVLGGELQLLSSADMPAEERMPGAPDDAIMHASLTVGGGLLMGSDDPTSDSVSMDSMRVHLTVESVEEVGRVFEALADGGTTQMPVSPTSWAAAFGMCVDRFGTPWMVSSA